MENIEFLLSAYFRSELDEETVRKVEQWIEESPENRETAVKYCRLEQYVLSVEEQERAEGEKLYAAAVSRLALKESKRRLLRNIAGTCAAAVLLAVLYLSVNLLSRDISVHEISCQESAPIGQTRHFVLSDNTEVWLNSGSVLKYPEKFRRQSRTVQLEGNAYFSVAKDSLRPFTVVTTKGEVKVLGTQFEVCSSSRDLTPFQVTLVCGSVQASCVLDGVRREALLYPGQRLTSDSASGKASIEEVDTESLTSWREGCLKFNHTALDEALELISRRYGVKFIINGGDAVFKENCSGVFMGQEVEEILKAIEKGTNVHFTKVSSKSPDRYLVYQ